MTQRTRLHHGHREKHEHRDGNQVKQKHAADREPHHVENAQHSAPALKTKDPPAKNAQHVREVAVEDRS